MSQWQTNINLTKRWDMKKSTTAFIFLGAAAFHTVCSFGYVDFNGHGIASVIFVCAGGIIYHCGKDV